MDKDFEKLIKEAQKIAIKRELSDYGSCGHVGCALLTHKGNIYTGISTDFNCALGNCAEYSAISEMLKNNESEIEKIVAYSPHAHAGKLLFQDAFFLLPGLKAPRHIRQNGSSPVVLHRGNLPFVQNIAVHVKKPHFDACSTDVNPKCVLAHNATNPFSSL